MNRFQAFEDSLRNKASKGSQGKTAERLLTSALLELSKSAFFDFERVDDARSSRGKNPKPRCGDFAAFTLKEGRHHSFVIECKEVDHAYRLPRGNFPLDQRARMRKRALTGAHAYVFVLFTPVKVWSVVPLSLLDDKETSGSWNFNELVVSFTFPENLEGLSCFFDKLTGS